MTALATSLWVFEAQSINITKSYKVGIKIPETFNKLVKSLTGSYRDLIHDYSVGKLGVRNPSLDCTIAGPDLFELIKMAFKKLNKVKK